MSLSKSWYKFLFDKIMIFTLPFGGKSLWQSFKNKKSEMTVSKDFPLASSWCTSFFLQTMFSGRNLENKMDTFYCIESSIHFASILFCKFLHENKVYRKNGVHHDEASGKSFETVISDFIFLKLCHRDFSPQSNVKNHNFIKKLVQFRHFFGHPAKLPLV